MSGGGGAGTGKVVCVTGASGYIASWLVKLLLERGYTVKATVRDPCDPRKTEHLVGLDGAKERLQSFKADLVDEGSFDSVVEGCDGVFHTATPVSFSYADPQTDVLDPAVNGTLNVLKACANVPSVKRVIVKSSLASVVFNGKPRTPDVVVDETWYSDPDVCKELKLWYMLAKTLAEQAAWKFANENSIDLVVLNPGMVIGPLLQPTLNLSVEFILNIIKGVEMHLGPSVEYVDVRDVAYAHVCAFEAPSASGRYCIYGRVAHNLEILKILHDRFPSLFLHKKYEHDKNPIEPRFHIYNEKAKGLGVNFMPLETTLEDTILSLKEKNLLTIRSELCFSS